MDASIMEESLEIMGNALRKLHKLISNQDHICNTFKTRTNIQGSDPDPDPWFEHDFAVHATDDERNLLYNDRVGILINISKIQDHLVAYSLFNPQEAEGWHKMLESELAHQKYSLDREQQGYELVTRMTKRHRYWQERAWELQEHIQCRRIELDQLYLYTP
ncbi:hypothetical protein BGZ91_011233 [Linnemannia elongata]|nr:hypothetical protein BGZ91_011233 [Linnemannia elongata]